MKIESSPFRLFVLFSICSILSLIFSQHIIYLPAAQAKDITAKNPSPHDDLSLLISKYGKPDIDDSTQYDKPRPPIVTRWLIYKKEHVEALYVPDGVSINDPPPYRKWKFVGFVDDKTKKPISAAEAVRRLQPRLRKP